MLFTLVAKENPVAAVSLLKTGHNCGSNVTATPLPDCYQLRCFRGGGTCDTIVASPYAICNAGGGTRTHTPV